MALDKTELEALLTRQGISTRMQKKILDGLDQPTASAPRSPGHGAPAPDRTRVGSM
jgi:hypothetical protein